LIWLKNYSLGVKQQSLTDNQMTTNHAFKNYRREIFENEIRVSLNCKKIKIWGWGYGV
jgi:hypothetical protein